MVGLHVHPALKEVKKVPKKVILLTFFETRFQDGRSGFQGVSKGCQRGAPGDLNVVPAGPDVAHGVVQGCPKGAQGVAMGAQAVPKGAQRVPKDASQVRASV